MRKLLILSLCLLMSATVTACKSEEVKNVESAISTMGEIDLDKKDMLLEIEDLYESLSEKDKSKVDNYDALESAWTSYDNILKDFEDEVKFSAKALVAIYNQSEVLKKESVINISFLTAADIQYAVFAFSNNGSTEIDDAILCVTTNESLPIFSKTLGVYDDETNFIVFFEPKGNAPKGIFENYFDNQINITEVVTLTERFFETGDYDFIDGGALAQQKTVAKPSSFNKTNSLVTDVLENWVAILALQKEFLNTSTPWDFDALDEIYYTTLSICEDTRRINLSGMSDQLEKLENYATYSLTMMTYENMMMNESFKKLDKEVMRSHLDKGMSYHDDFLEYNDQFEEQFLLHSKY